MHCIPSLSTITKMAPEPLFVQLLLGDWVEVVLHNLIGYPHEWDPQHSLFWIGGKVTERRVGAPITNFALDMLAKNLDSDRYMSEYMGKKLWCGSRVIRDANHEVFGFLCINVDLDRLLAATPAERQLLLGLAENNKYYEVFAKDPDEAFDVITSKINL